MVTNSPRYRVVPVGADIARHVRKTRQAPGYGHPAHLDLATGYGPCRVCLEPLKVHEDECLLFTYDPFAGREPFPLPSPIYIHARACAPYAGTEEFPDGLRFIPLTLNAYARGARLVGQVRIEDGYGGRVEEAVGRLFADPSVDYVHVRNTAAGCFIVRLDRT